MAAVFGWDIVLNERGWVMVIAGSVLAANGFLMLGLVTIAVRLGRIRRAISHLATQQGRIEPALPTDAALESVAPVVAVAAAADAFAVAPPGKDEPPPLEPLPLEPLPPLPPLPSFMQPRDETAAEEAARREPLPDLPPLPEFPPIAPPAFEAPMAVEPVAAAMASAVASPVEPPPERVDRDEPVEAPPTVVGTYNSGDNRYVMYSDGSIRADTPNGEFRFGSLDELKSFISHEGTQGRG